MPNPKKAAYGGYMKFEVMYELSSIKELKDYFLGGTELFRCNDRNFTVEEAAANAYVVIFRNDEDLPTDTVIASSLLDVYALFR